MKNSLTSLFVGFLFALGLGLSGMTQPQKVVGFLDVFGNWDPSLMFVMIGAISVHFILYKVIRRRKSPLFSMDWQVPSKKEITPALVLGAFIFGIGWGLGGYCPGPAITSLASFEGRPLIFVISMLIGMLLFNLMDKKLKIKR
jgi:hypothetical protein